jgi:hypothetical protein
MQATARVWADKVKVCILGGCFLVVVGCGSKPTGTIEGQVKYKDKALPAGSVIFAGEDNKSYMSPIDAQGNYKIENVPVGTVKIAITLPSAPNIPTVPGGKDKIKLGLPKDVKLPPGVDPGYNMDVPKDLPKLPPEVGNPQTSGMSYAVTAGKQQHNIDIPTTVGGKKK